MAQTKKAAKPTGAKASKTTGTTSNKKFEDLRTKTEDQLNEQLVELKREHAHVHLGFADNQVQGWLKSAGLNPLEPIHFPGRRIMTGIWRGERELPARTAARHTAHPVHGVSR